MVGNGIWEVFSTKEWEDFATKFYCKYANGSFEDSNDAFKIKSEDKCMDGRKRLNILLPDIHWIRRCNHEEFLEDFLIKPMGNNYHVPKYLDLLLMVADSNDDGKFETKMDCIMDDCVGSAKLIYISKPKRTFTVIIYGV